MVWSLSNKKSDKLTIDRSIRSFLPFCLFTPLPYPITSLIQLNHLYDRNLSLSCYSIGMIAQIRKKLCCNSVSNKDDCNLYYLPPFIWTNIFMNKWLNKHLFIMLFIHTVFRKYSKKSFWMSSYDVTPMQISPLSTYTHDRKNYHFNNLMQINKNQFPFFSYTQTVYLLNANAANDCDF